MDVQAVWTAVRRVERATDALAFRAGVEDSVLIEVGNKRPQTLRAGLRAAMKNEATDDVRLVQRAEETYLVRLDS